MNAPTVSRAWLRDAVPHFSTFEKDYMRRFQDTGLFERIFQKIRKECMKAGLVEGARNAGHLISVVPTAEKFL